MIKVFVKHNPYRITTKIEIDGKELPQNSKLRERTRDGARLQEWIEYLPQILVEDTNARDFEVTFHGTLLDYEDVASVFADAVDRGKLKAAVAHRPAKETSDKEALIDEVFAEIQKGPFDELRNPEIITAFNHAKSDEFEVCVVATMSAGKSTLINAMLGRKLMPSKQEACTAIITRIKDEDKAQFSAEVYGKEGELREKVEPLTNDDMERLNLNKEVFEIKISGDIPFVTAEDVSLVLVDTPGPNNSRDPRHKNVQSEFLAKSSKTLVLYVTTASFGTDDNDALLDRIVKSMSVGGKQSKDRFIFIVNKLDDRKDEDGDIETTLDRIRSFLKDKHIDNPQLFPAAALPALNIRLIENGADVDIDTREDTETKIKKLNRRETLHFERHATLPSRIQKDILGRLETARSEWETTGKPQIENPSEALIHTGIISVEAAIKQYVQKYAKVAKIKNIADTFTGRLQDLKVFEKVRQRISENEEEKERTSKDLAKVKKKITDGHDAKEFISQVDKTAAAVRRDSIDKITDIITRFQSRITRHIDTARKAGKIEKQVALQQLNDLERFAKNLEDDFETELNHLISDSLVRTGNALLSEYKEKLASLTEDINPDGSGVYIIDPLKLMSGSVRLDCFSMMKSHVRRETRAVGTETYQVIERTRGWFESWKFLPKSELVTKYRTLYEEVEYVEKGELAQDYLTPAQTFLHKNGDVAREHVKQQSKKIVNQFQVEFQKLDDLLVSKLEELERCANDHDYAEKRLAESKRNLDWLLKIQENVDSILDI